MAQDDDFFDFNVILPPPKIPRFANLPPPPKTEELPPKPKDGFFYVRGISALVKEDFKAYCTAKGYTMSLALEYLMKQAVANQAVLPLPQKGARKPKRR